MLRWWLGIRARLLLLALATLSPLVAVLIFQDYYHLVAARQRADADANRLALLKAGEIDDHLLAIETQIAAIRAVVSADSSRRPSNEAMLAPILQELPAYIDGITAHASTGEYLGGSWRDNPGYEIPSAAIQDQITDAEASPNLVVGPLLTPQPARAGLALASRALANRAGAMVVLTLALRLDRMPFLADVRGLPRGSTVSVIDVRGPLLARSSLDQTSGVPTPGARVVAPAPRPLDVDRRPTTTEDRVVGYALADRAPWVVYVDVPVEVALIAARTDFVRDLMLGGVMLVLALLLAWLISERITAPIRQLTADAAVLGTGQLSRRTTVHSADEIGMLAGVFNETAGAIEHLVGDLRTAQIEVRALNIHLEQRVRDRTAQLAALNTELEAFSFAVSHDLRAPLRRIDGYSRALLEDFGEKLDDDGRMMLTRLTASTDQMGQLIDDLLRLSLVSRAELNYQPVDLANTIAEVVDELRAAHPEHPVTVSIVGDLTVRGDPSLLRVVVQNLLANAWKFTRGRTDARIECGESTSERMRTFYIRDNGVGFDPTKSDKLFRAFQRLHDARDFEGTGVGLATVQRIIHRHGGLVWADGTLGSGATFWFTVPDWLEGG
jgi:signal transduction histidine kinase